MSGGPIVELITRTDCPLCAEGRSLLERLAGRFRIAVVEHGIDDPGLAAYAERVPVVRTARGRVIDEGRLSRLRLVVWLTAIKAGAGRAGR